jgi:Na+/proline symporter
MDTMLGLHVADIVVLGLYLLGMAAIGFWSAKKIKQSSDFFERTVRNLVSVALASLHALLLADRSGHETVSCYHNG